MMIALHSQGMIKALLVLVVVSAVLLLSRRDLLSLFRSYAWQSLFLGFIALIIYSQEQEVVLLYTALLTFVSKVWFIPLFLRKVQKRLDIKRDLEFRYLRQTSSVFMSAAIIVVVYSVFSPLLKGIDVSGIFAMGSVLGMSLAFMGLVVCFSRKEISTKVVGYLTMENGVVLFSLFLGELPFLIEALVLMDLLMVVMITAIMAFGMNTSIEEFHEHLNLFGRWLDEVLAK